MSNDLEIGIYKGRDGWSARSRVALDEHGLPGRILEINTDKWPNGGIWSQVICVRIERGAKVWEIYGDFQKTMAKEPKTRCTEKNVKQMQQASVAQLDALLAECVNFYRKKGAAQ